MAQTDGGRARWVNPLLVLLAILIGLAALAYVLTHVIPPAQRPSLGPTVSSMAAPEVPSALPQ